MKRSNWSHAISRRAHSSGRGSGATASRPLMASYTSMICAAEPAQAAQAIVERGFTPSYPYALDALSKLPYNLWREWDPNDTLRFYALRLDEAGLIKSSPQKIIADGTDWHSSKSSDAS